MHGGISGFKGRGLFENYDKIRKGHKVPLGRVYQPNSIGTRKTYAQFYAESLVQRLSLQYTAAEIAQLKVKGWDVVDTLLSKYYDYGNLGVVALMHEVIVEGKVVRAEFKERPHGQRVAAIFVVSDVLKGDLSVGDTIRIVDSGEPHSFIYNRGGEEIKIPPSYSRMIVGLVKKSFPLIVGYWGAWVAM